MPKQKLEFNAAYEELTIISERMQNGELGIEELSKSVARAKELVTFCKGKLRGVEKELDTLLTQEYQ